MLNTTSAKRLDEHLVLYRARDARRDSLPQAFACRALDETHAAELLASSHEGAEACSVGAIKPGETPQLTALRLLLVPNDSCATADPIPLLDALAAIAHDRAIHTQREMWRTLKKGREIAEHDVCALDRSMYVQAQVAGAKRFILQGRSEVAELRRTLGVAHGLLSRASEVLAGIQCPAATAIEANIRRFFSGIDFDQVDGAEILRKCLEVAVGEFPHDWEDADGVPIGRFLIPAVAGDLASARRELEAYEVENAAALAAQQRDDE